MSSRTEFSHEDVLRILEIVDAASEVEVRVEVNGLKLHFKKFSTSEILSEPPLHLESEAGAGAPAEEMDTEMHTGSDVAPLTPTSSVEPRVEPVAGTKMVYAPTVGCFFRSSSPHEPPYVEVGDKVDPDDPVCLLEIMKVFNTIRSGVKGTVTEVLASDGEMVEQGQPLFVVTLED